MADFIVGALLVAFGFALGLIPPSWARRRRRLSHWNFLKVEVDACGQIAADLVIKGDEGGAEQEPGFVVEEKKVVLSPLFRLPVTSYATSFPALLAEETLAEDEIKNLVTFFGHVHEINRGLDYAAEMYKLNEEKMLWRERGRVSLKAEKIVQPLKDSQSSLYDTCLRIASEHAKTTARWGWG